MVPAPVEIASPLTPPSSLTPTPDAGPALARWPVTAVLAGAIVAALDVLLSDGARALPSASLASALAAAVALYALPALLIGTGCALWLAARPPSVSAFFAPPEPLDPESDQTRAAGALTGALAALVLCALTFLFAHGIAVEMANKRNTALSTALFAPLAGVLGTVAALPFFRPLRRLCGLLPPPRLRAVLLLLLLGASVVIVLALLTIDWRALRFGPAKAAVGFILVQAALLRLRVARGLDQVPAGARWPALPGLVAVSVCTALLGVDLAYTFGALGASRFGDDPQARALLAEHSAGAKPLLLLARRLCDRDHDGYAAVLGGGDCDDRDPTVHPGADDTPGDGIDQDCEGGDASAQAAAPPTEEPPPAGFAAAPAPKPAPPPASPGARRWDGNWLFITVDTLRTDRVNEKVSPALAALAREGARFENVYAQAPNTPRSFPSFLTSRLPSQVHFTRKTYNFSPVTGADPTVFTALAQAGYRNLGIFSHFYLDPKIGLQRGFAEWRNDGATTLHDSNSDIAAPRITKRVVDRIKQLGAEARGGKAAPFALWTHLFDPHSTYMDHPEFPVAGKGFKYLAARYDAEVSFTDQHIGQIIAALKAAGLYERTAIVVFADHGEAFGEHRLGGEPLYFHGESLYDEVLRVPLIIRVPGQAPRVLADRVMLIDLAPTVLDLSGVPAPPEFRGRSLAPLVTGSGTVPAQPVFAELLPCTAYMHHERVVIDGEHKLYVKYTENTTELYHLPDDPTEQRNLASARPEVVRALKALLAQRHD